MEINKMAKAVGDSNFVQEVVQSKIPVLVDFWAEWCGPCRMLGPVIDELSAEFEGRVKVVKLNIDDNPEIPAKYGVRSIPTLMLFKDGEAVDTKIGSLPKTKLQSWLESAS